MAESKHYNYFDTPEGEDIFKKLWAVIKPTALTGIAISTVDVLCFPQKRSYPQLLGRYAYFTLPLIGIVSAFVVTTNLAVNYRHKDDKFNWTLGALAAGGIFGAWRRSIQAGSNACIAFTIAAIGKKHCLQNGYTIMPLKNQNAGLFGALHGPRYDWTLTQERPRNWTRGQ